MRDYLCKTCKGDCRLTTTGNPMSRDDIVDDLQSAHQRWHKARQEGRYFRAEKWAQLRDEALDHLIGVS